MHIPVKIKLDKTRQLLILNYADGSSWQLSAEFLRVHSPSAEVQGHGHPILQHGKKDVQLTGVKATGNYALSLTFDDGHDSGIYSWDYLYRLATNQQAMWDSYLAQLSAAGKFRDPHQSAVKLIGS